MPVATTAAPVAAVTRLRRDRTERGLFRARELSASTILIAAVGEVDAANSGDLLAFIREQAAGYRQLVLDLSRLDFFGTDGFSTLHTVNVCCSRSGVDWVTVPGPAVSRVLRVCDHDGALNTASNIVSAMAALARGPHTLLQVAPLRK